MTLSQRAVEAAVDAYENNVDDRGNLVVAMKAAISAALAVDGLCLVPREPSDKMIDAGDVRVARGAKTWMSGSPYPEEIYRAMIAAASDGGDSQPAGTEG